MPVRETVHLIWHVVKSVLSKVQGFPVESDNKCMSCEGLY